jgi:hypothetical protein
MHGRPSSRLAPKPLRLPRRGPAQALPALALLFFGLAVLATSACTRRIGDACTTNVECSPLGDRFCDLASPSGYCTVEGCDSSSCPDSAVCVRFFSLKVGDGAQCDSQRVAMTAADCANSSGCCVAGTPGCCKIGEQCLCSQEGCGTQGYCASESTERRWCMHACSNDGDCRDGYQCRPTGTNGSLAVTYLNPDGTTTVPVYSYCAPPL